MCIQDAKTLLRFNWNAAIAQDPFDKKTLKSMAIDLGDKFENFF